MIESAAALRSWIDAEPTLLGGDWFEALEERKQEEAGFHDSDRTGHRDERGDSTANRKFYDAATPVWRHTEDWLQRMVPGKAFLDYACGNGRMTILAAKAGAALAVGIDISPVSVKNAAENSANAGVAAITRFLQRDCEATGLPNGAFDVCICAGMLHHLDLSRALPELYRIMAPGGRILCVEALGYNPVIQWYRNRTPQLRTEWETRHILTLREVADAKRWFAAENVRFHLLSAPLAALLPRPLRGVGFRAGHAVDVVLTRVPLLKLWSWMFSFELVKQ